MKKIFQNKILLLLLVSAIVGIFLRFYYLNSLPVSLSHDEIDNVIQAQSVIHTGRDIVGTWTPLSFLPNSGVMSELGPLINVPTLSLLPQSLESSRFMTVLYSLVFPLLVLLWLKNLGFKSSIAYLSAALLYLSPWHVIFSRTALEQPTSLFYYMLSWVFLTSLYNKKFSAKKLIGFCISFAIGFYTYHGFKFTLPLLTGIELLYLSRGSFSNLTKPKFYLPTLFVIFLFARVVFNSTLYGSRGDELVISNISKYSGTVNTERTYALSGTTLKSIFINKYAILGKTLLANYVDAYSPTRLFVEGEENGVFSVGSGYLYFFTAPLLLYGVYALFQKKKPERKLILLLLVISPLSSVLHINNSLAFRSAIFLVLLNVTLGIGLYEPGYSLTKKNHLWGKLYSSLLAIFFILALFSFSYRYFSVSPVENSQAYFFDERLLAEYVNRNPDKKILIIDHQPRYIMSNIILDRKVVGDTDIKSLNHGYSPKEEDIYRLDNLTVTGPCPREGDYDTAIVRSDTQDYLRECPLLNTVLEKNPQIHQFVSPLDSGALRIILGDTMCDDKELRRYINPTSLSDFDLGKLDDQSFCLNWVVNN